MPKNDLDPLVALTLDRIADQASYYLDALKERGFTEAQAFELTIRWHENCVIPPRAFDPGYEHVAEAMASLARAISRDEDDE